LIFAFVAGLSLASSLAFIGWSFSAWIALVPLIILIKSSQSLRSCLAEVLVFFLVYNLVSFIWLLGLHPLTWHGFNIHESFFIALLAWFSPAIFHSLLLVPFAIAMKAFFEFRTDERTRELATVDILFLAFIWTVIEHKIMLNLGPIFGIFTVPINLLAYSQYNNLMFIQVCNIIGAIGLEFFIVAFNLFLSNFFNIHKIHSRGSLNLSKFNVRHPFAGVQRTNQNLFNICLVLLIMVIGSTYSFGQVGEFKARTQEKKNIRTFAVAQAGFSAAETRGTEYSTEKVIQALYDISRHISSIKDIVVWPEAAVPSTNRGLINSEPLRLMDSYARVFVFGTYVQKSNKVFNSIEITDFMLGQNHFYHKQNLVPFGEYTPLFSILPPFLKDLAKSAVGDGFSRGPRGPKPIITSEGELASSVCFELLFPVLIRDQVSKGAEFIINVNDLSWFKNDLVKKLFLATAVFRAIENKRDILLASNAGFSAHINAIGQIDSITKPNEPGLFVGNLVKNQSPSLYTKYGW
jgi:apolipoprotein N-acyltransferase